MSVDDSKACGENCTRTSHDHDFELPKAAPILADRYARKLADPRANSPSPLEEEVLVALRVAENHPRLPTAIACKANGCEINGVAFYKADDPAIVAALRAVEAVRAFAKVPEDCPWQTCGTYGPEGLPPCSRCKAYRDGVEAVQALLEGEK